MKVPSIITDQYLEFQCVGGDCPNNCCARGWKILVDPDTERRYREVEGDFGARLNAIIDRSQTPAMIKLDKNGRCPMLTEDGWCAVQRELGADALCEVCRTYPRRIHSTGGGPVYNLTASCPEVARQLLTRKKPLRLTFSEIKFDVEGTPILDETARPALETSVKILQDRDIDISRRQLLFLLFNQGLDDAGDDKEARLQLATYFSRPANRRALAAVQTSQTRDLPSKLRLLNRLCAPMLAEFGRDEATTLLEDVLQFVLSSDGGIERAAPYLAQLDDGTHARELENVLVQNCLSDYLDEKLLDGDRYLQSAYVVALSQLWRLFCAVGSAREGKLLPLDERVRYWSLLARAFQHNDLRRERVGNILREEGLLEIQYLFHLIS